MKKRIIGGVLAVMMCASIGAYAENTEKTQVESVVIQNEIVENVAIGSSVTVTNTSGSQINTNVGDDAFQCVDGSYSTGTSGNGVFEYNIGIELADIYPINKVNMVFLICKFDGDFEIQTSTDGVNYTKAANIKNTLTPFEVNTAGEYFYTADFETVFAKYVRIVDKSSHSGLGFRVAEIEIGKDSAFSGEQFSADVTYQAVSDTGNIAIENLFAGTIKANLNTFYYGGGKEVIFVSGLYNTLTKEMVKVSTVPLTIQNGTNTYSTTINVQADLTGLMSYDELAGANVALGAECKMYGTSTGEELQANSGNVASNATDGKLSTIAQATGAYDWTLYTDLGESRKISSLRVTFAENGFPVEYDVLVSEDAENWKSVESIKGNDRGGEHIINFDTIEARYIRIADKVPQPGVRQMQVCELEIFEKKIKSDYEIRSFVIDNGKNPLVKQAYILN